MEETIKQSINDIAIILKEDLPPDKSLSIQMILERVYVKGFEDAKSLALEVISTQ